MSLRETSPQPLADEVVQLLARMPQRPPVSAGTAADARNAKAQVLAISAPGPTLAHVEDVMVGRLPLRIYRPNDRPPAWLLYFHGGGWIMGSIDDSDAHVRRMAVATGCAIISVDYRLAPEYPFPAAIEDAIAAWDWLCGAHAPAVPLGIGGESAGGNIAAGATIAIRDTGRTMPAFQILGYPVLSADMNSPSYAGQVEGPVLSAEDMRWFWDQYVPDTSSRADPRAAPLAATDFSGLPPALIMAAACDPLRDEAADFADRLRQAGVPVRFRCFSGMIHGFYKMADVLEGGREALAETAAFVRDRVEQQI